MNDSELLISITHATIEITGVTFEQITSGTRQRDVADAKRLLASIACDFGIHPQITSEFLDCDRCTVIYLDGRCFELCAADKDFAGKRAQIMKKLFNNPQIMAYLKK